MANTQNRANTHTHTVRERDPHTLTHTQSEREIDTHTHTPCLGWIAFPLISRPGYAVPVFVNSTGNETLLCGVGYCHG